MIQNIQEKFDTIEKTPRLFKIKIENNNLLNTVDFLISSGFITLVQISCTDWIEDEIFSLNYNFTTEKKDINLFVQVDINRVDETVPTLSKIFPQAEIIERDLHEMFGITFSGNNTLFDFALENWQEIPPLRREFDTLAYVHEHFDFRGGRDDNKDTKAETKRRRAEAKKLKELQEQQEVSDANESK